MIDNGQSREALLGITLLTLRNDPHEQFLIY